MLLFSDKVETKKTAKISQDMNVVFLYLITGRLLNRKHEYW